MKKLIYAAVLSLVLTSACQTLPNCKVVEGDVSLYVMPDECLKQATRAAEIWQQKTGWVTGVVATTEQHAQAVTLRPGTDKWRFLTVDPPYISTYLDIAWLGR